MLAEDVNRLGPFRRNKRDYSVLQRSTGKDAGDRMAETKFKKMGILTLGMFAALQKQTERDVIDDIQGGDFVALFLLVFSAVSFLKVCDLCQPRLIWIPPILRIDVSFDSLTYEAYDQLLGFTKAESQQLFELMAIPQTFTLNDPGSRHKFNVSGQHSFLYFLSRMHSPSARQTIDRRRWHYCHTTLGKMFNAVVDHLDATWGHRLQMLPSISQRFPHFNQKIVQKMATLVAANEPLPDDCVHCALFVDGCRFEVCRPDGAFWRQKLVFSGDKWFHNHGSQGVMAPDGMIYDWWDRPLGRFSDRHFMADSGLNDLLRAIQLGNLVQFWAYSDKGYDRDTHIRCAAHGPGHVSAAQQHANYLMSRERISVEWAFGKVKQRCPFVARWELLKLQQVDVAAYIRVAVLLTNAHTCLHQSQTGLYFDCQAPSLQAYFSV